MNATESYKMKNHSDSPVGTYIVILPLVVFVFLCSNTYVPLGGINIAGLKNTLSFVVPQLLPQGHLHHPRRLLAPCLPRLLRLPPHLPQVSRGHFLPLT